MTLIRLIAFNIKPSEMHLSPWDFYKMTVSLLKQSMGFHAIITNAVSENQLLYFNDVLKFVVS